MKSRRRRKKAYRGCREKKDTEERIHVERNSTEFKFVKFRVKDNCEKRG